MAVASGNKLCKGGSSKGTIFAASGFNADEDAERIKKATKGFGTDEGALISILCKRNNDQRQKIKAVYKQKYGEDIIKMLKSEVSGNFENVIVGLMEPTAVFDATCLKAAMKGAGTDEQALIDIICTKTNKEMQQLKAAYKQINKSDIEKDVTSEVTGDFRRLLVSVLSGTRDESSKADRGKAQADAKRLYDAGARKLGTDEATFNEILCRQSTAQVCALIDEYKKLTNKHLIDAITSEFSGDLRNAYYSMVASLYNKSGYFAYSLYKSMKGLGTNDSRLIRIIIARSEVDLQTIKDQFEKFYGKSLEAWVSSECSGDYKNSLLTLIRGNR